MDSMADRLCHLHEYATTHRVVDLGLLLEAADEIERLERQAAEVDGWLRENLPEICR